MDDTLLRLRDQVVLWLPSVAASIVIFIIFWIISRIVRRVIRGIGKTANLDAEVRQLIEDVVGLAILMFGLITALGTVGINVTALVAGLGLTGFALGFALQDIISNTLSGILILVYKPFKTGDFITVGSHEGAVIGIDLRYTTLQGEANWILIPNATLFKEAIMVSEPGAERPVHDDEGSPPQGQPAPENPPPPAPQPVTPQPIPQQDTQIHQPPESP